MKFLVRSGYGESLAIALRLQSEGNKVRFSVADPQARTVGDGLIEKAPTFEGSVQWAEVVVFDGNGLTLPKEAEAARSVRPIIGSGKLAHQLEEDRRFAMTFAREAGLNVSEFEQFEGPSAWRKAVDFLAGRDKNEGWVFKPNGESPVTTYVSRNIEELYRMLDYYRTAYEHDKDHPKVSFLLMPKIEGAEVSTEAWFNGQTFCCPNVTFERTRFMDHDHGEKVGCMGNVVSAIVAKKLYEALLAPLAGRLQGKYWGPIDVNSMIEKESNEPVFLEFTPRLGYDAIFAFAELCPDLGKLFHACATGNNVSTSLPTDRVAGAVRCSVPPFPHTPENKADTEAEGVPVFGWNSEKQTRHLSPCEVRLNHDGEPESSGPSGYLFVASSTGESPTDAMEAAYKEVEKLHVPQLRYRGDLAEAIQEVYDQVEATGWLSEDAEPAQSGLIIFRRDHYGRNKRTGSRY